VQTSSTDRSANAVWPGGPRVRRLRRQDQTCWRLTKTAG